MSQRIYQDLHASIMRFCSDLADTWVESKPTFVNFDAHADSNELPKTDVIGPLALSFEINDHLLEGTVMMGYSSLEDKNLFRMVDRVSAMVNKLKPSNKIAVYDSLDLVSGPIGLIVIQNGTKVQPVASSKLRPVQFIMVSFLSTITFKEPEETSGP